MQITKKQLKKIIKEELQRFSESDQSIQEMSQEAQDALEALSAVTNEDELRAVVAMAQAKQSLSFPS